VLGVAVFLFAQEGVPPTGWRRLRHAPRGELLPGEAAGGTAADFDFFRGQPREPGEDGG
jgi:hypothetical protein